MTFDPLALLDAVHGPWLWMLVGVLAAAESAAMLGLLVPGETALVLAGVAVGVGHGGPAVFLARWVGLLRAVVPAVAGAVGMPRRVFVLWNALGGALWAASVVLLGVVAGRSWAGVQHWFGVAGAAAGLVGVVAVVLALRASRRRTAPRQAPGPGEHRVLEASS